MRTSRALTLALFFLFGSFTTIFAATIPRLRDRSTARIDVVSGEKYVHGQLLVRFRSNVTAGARTAVHRTMKASVATDFEAVPSLELVNLPEDVDVHEAIRQYAADPEVLYAEPNFVVKALGTPDDPGFQQQWQFNNIGQLGGGVVGADIHAPQAWELSTGSKSAVVVVIDSGVDYAHTDLKANLFNNPGDCNGDGVDDDGDGYADDCYGINTTAHTSDPLDDYGHGTHVSGLIGAVGNNGLGVSGVNWNVQIVACKFLDQWGNGTVAGALECLNYAKTLKQRGMNVVATNNSWGGAEFSQALADAIDAQRQAGILFVAAAGNDYSDNDLNPVYPANYTAPNIISVAATTNSDRLALFSNVGAHSVHIAAPGQEILSTWPGNQYAVLSGTSMAAPLVTGVAALLSAHDPSLTWKEIKNRILAGGDPEAGLLNTVTGKRLNAFGALTCSNAPVLKRLSPPQRNVAAAVGSPLVITYLNVNCAQPGSALQATVSTGESVALTDDGNGADVSANDGVFAGSWIPTVQGSYTVSLPDGDVLGVQVLTAYRAIQEVGNYREIAGTSLNLSDDSVARFTPPFPIHYGEGSFSDVYVSSDGTISFTNPFQSFYNRLLPLLSKSIISRVWDSSAVTLLAPFWDDLYPVQNTDQNVFWAVTGTAPSRELVIEWRNVRLFDCRSDANKTVTFEIVLRENDNNVYYEYKNVQSGCALSYNRHDFGASATVGLQIAPSSGSTWFFADGASWTGKISNGTGLRWQLVTIPVQDNPSPTITKLNPNQADAGSPDTTITITGTNFVPGSTASWDTEIASPYGSLRATYVSPTELSVTIPSINLQPSVVGQHKITVSNPAPGGGVSNALPFGVGMTPAVITSLLPASAVAGGPGFTMTVVGTGFGTDSSQYLNAVWNNSMRTVRWVSSTQIQFDVTAYDIAQPGTAKVQVYVNGWGTTNTIDFPITAASNAPGLVDMQNGVAVPGMQPRPYRFLGWGVGSKLGDAYLAKFSRSFAGPALAATVSSSGTTNVQNGLPSLPFGSSLPGLALRPTLPTGYIPASVAMADFNGDGKMDWAIANGGDNSIWIYIGHGDGTWELPRIIRLRGLSPVALVAADLRGNGVHDLLVAEIDSASLGLLRGRGDGTFDEEDEYLLPAPPTYLCSGDFNNDGQQDVLVGTLGTVEQGALILMKGDGSGRLGSPVWFPNHKRYVLTAPSAAWLAVGDWNKDSFLDVTASEPFTDATSESGLIAYLNRQDGSFKEAQEVFDNYFVGVYGVAAGDINEDGCMDLIVLTGGAAQATVGRCDGSFTEGPESAIGLGDFSYGVKLADVNGDGHLDLVTSGIITGQGGGGYGNESGALITVALGIGDGHFRRPRVFRGEASAFMFDIGDVNGDGRPDVITANQDSDSATLFLNIGNGDFGSPSGDYVGYHVDGNGGGLNSPLSEPKAANILGNGRLDIGYIENVRFAGDPYNITILPNLSNGKLGAPVRTPIGTGGFYYFFDFLFGDFRNTGRGDLVALRGGSSNLEYLFAPANSDGSFGTPVVVQTNSSWGALGSGDFNRDGKLDFVIVDVISGGLRLSVYLGDGSGKFTPITPTILSGSFGTRPYSVMVHDQNKDGVPDVLVWLSYNVVPYTDHDVYEFLGKGDGTFATGRVVLKNMDPFRVADLNNDGFPDAVEFSAMMSSYPLPAVPQVRVYLGQPDGSFTVKETYSPYDGVPRDAEQGRVVVIPPATSRLADFDGDGKVDAAVFQTPSQTDHSVYVQFLKGNGDGTFTPTFAKYRLATSSAPNLAADFNGDGAADLFDLVAYAASWNIIPGTRGPQLQLNLSSEPVAGSRGILRITMNGPADQPLSVALTSSDPAIVVPNSVTIPAGTNVTDVPFEIANTFESTHTFSITGTISNENYTVYGSQLPGGMLGFALATNSPLPSTILPAQEANYPISIISKSGWQGSIFERCEGLPAGANCVFPSSLTVPPGKTVSAGLKVSTTAAVGQGKYDFSFVASDGFNEIKLQLQLKVGDYGVEVSPGTSKTLSTGWATFNVNLPSTQGYSGYVSTSCTGLPATATCNNSGNSAGSPVQLIVYSSGTAPGNYPFTIVGTSGEVSRSAGAILRVVDVNATYTPQSGSVKVGGTFTSTVKVDAPNGFDEQVSFICYAPSNVTCAITPSTLTFASTSDSKDVQVTLTALRMSASKEPAPSNGRGGWPTGGGYLAFLGTITAGLFAGRNKSARSLLSVALAIGLCAGLLSCGGGGGGGSTTPTTPTTPPPAPPPATNTVSVSVYLKSPSIDSRLVGVIQLKISE